MLTSEAKIILPICVRGTVVKRVPVLNSGAPGALKGSPEKWDTKHREHDGSRQRQTSPHVQRDDKNGSGRDLQGKHMHSQRLEGRRARERTRGLTMCGATRLPVGFFSRLPVRRTGNPRPDITGRKSAGRLVR